MTIALRALPELLGWPRVLGSGVLQLHLGAAPLTTNTDVGVVHGEILVFRPGDSQHESVVGHPTEGRAGLLRSETTRARSNPSLRPAAGGVRN